MTAPWWPPFTLLHPLFPHANMQGGGKQSYSLKLKVLIKITYNFCPRDTARRAPPLSTPDFLFLSGRQMQKNLFEWDRVCARSFDNMPPIPQPHQRSLAFNGPRLSPRKKDGTADMCGDRGEEGGEGSNYCGVGERLLDEEHFKRKIAPSHALSFTGAS